jgi:plasmid stabilization system protein ParE
LTYVLTEDAETDLRGIIRHTRQEWGAAQVRSYVAKLTAGLADVATGRPVP